MAASHSRAELAAWSGTSDDGLKLQAGESSNRALMSA